MNTRVLVATAALLLAPSLAPVAAAFPYPIFDPACPQYPDYVIVQYFLHPFVNYCLDGTSVEGPSGTYPEPHVGIGFPDTCVGDECVERVCSPGPYRVCWYGTPTPNVYFFDRPYQVSIPTGVHGFVELTAACGVVDDCRIDFAADVPPVLA